MANKVLLMMQAAYHSIMPEKTRLGMYERLPHSVRSKMDKLSTEIGKRPLTTRDLKLPSGPIAPSRFPRRVNKLCDEADWYGEDWFSVLDAMGESDRRVEKHRKAWEWAQGVYALQNMNLLRQDATAVGVGAGVEGVLFYLANQIKMVYATDIYGEGDFVEDTAFADMLTDPARYANIPYREDHLQVMHMNGLDLAFPDNFCDFAFSFSSIEHFGGHEAAAQAVREMGRIVKPGGAIVLATEVILNGIDDEELFLPEEIQSYLIEGSGLQPIEDIDYSISNETLAHYVDTNEPDYGLQLPHIVLKLEPKYWTSLCLVLIKPG